MEKHFACVRLMLGTLIAGSLVVGFGRPAHAQKEADAYITPLISDLIQRSKSHELCGCSLDTSTPTKEDIHAAQHYLQSNSDYTA